MNNEDTISQILLIVLGVMVCIFVILVTIFVVLKTREKIKEKDNIKSKSNKKNTTTKTSTASYNKQSVINFMEFEKIEDNMIIQKKGKKYLMVVECQGVNYDLMSKMEKISVEEGFQQFLNTLRHPIQIYIQTRTISLESSLATYKEKINQI